MKPMSPLQPLLLFSLCLFVLPDFSVAQQAETKVDLSVGIFMYLPDCNSAIERLEKAFEGSKLGNGIDVDFELFEPYQKPNDPEFIRKAIEKYDVVEIDLVRLDDLLGGETQSLDKLPKSVVFDSDQYVSGARDVADSSQAQYLLPHLVCGQYFVFWKGNAKLEGATTFKQILAALDHVNGKKLFADLAGSGTLGEFYADALLDMKGEDFTREHFKTIHSMESVSIDKLDQDAVKAIKLLFDELDPALKKNVGYYHDNASHYFPFEFAMDTDSALIGYSERLFYVQRQLMLATNESGRTLDDGELVVRQFPFAESSNGTPTWVDGFVIPKGKLAQKQNAIERFLKFTVEEEGYLPFVVPAEWPPTSTYLLPAHVNGYSESLLKKQPNISQYKTAFEKPFTINSSDIWRGIRKAGGLIEDELNR